MADDVPAPFLEALFCVAGPYIREQAVSPEEEVGSVDLVAKA